MPNAPIVAVIGAGQIGSRHLQSLAVLRGGVKLLAIDPSPSSHRLIRERLGADAGWVEIHDDLDHLPQQIDVAIVATSAAARRGVITKLLATHSVRHLVLEKILFPSVADCLWAADFLARFPVTTWVNFPRRLQPIYAHLAGIPRDSPVWEIRVSGSQWGMASNAVHFLDLILFLSNERVLGIEEFEARTMPSRHPGCLECSGVITGRTGSGVRFSITSGDTGNAPIQVAVDAAVGRWIVRESGSETLAVYASEATAWAWQDRRDPFLFQSQLTAGVVSSLLESGRCNLATLEAAVAGHIPFLRMWNRCVAKVSDFDNSSCPVT